MKKILSVLLLLLAASTANAQSVAIGATQATSDAATGTLIIHGRNAYPRATTNTTGGAVKLCPGLGRRLATIVDYSLVDDVDTVTVTIDGTASVLTAGGTDWKQGVSNTVTAQSLAMAVNKLSGVFATPSGAVVYITALPTTCTLTIATSMTSGEGTVTSGSDGVYSIGAGVTFSGVAATAFRGFSVSGTTTAYNYSEWINTGGQTIAGVENSAGAGLVTGTTAYDSFFGAASNTGLSLLTNSTVRLRVSNAGAVNIPGTFLVTGVSTFTVSPVITTAASPTAAGACTAGTVSWDTGYLYVCTASGASKRVALTGGY